MCENVRKDIVTFWKLQLNLIDVSYKRYDNTEVKCDSRILFFPHIHKKVIEHTRQKVRK